MEIAILVFYTLALLVVFLYALGQLHLLLNYLKAKKRPVVEIADIPERELPQVTIQLPIYNEKNVVERLLENISKLDYPREKLQIQVLDDSNDDSVELTRNQVEKLKKTGLDITHIDRDNRKNYKAGALKNGLETAKGEFIAVFDADFLPPKNWLKKTLPHFSNEKTGVVQTRWGHLNRNYNWLTKIQAFALDFHFILEQTGRNFGGHFINFNGTAGIWRKECILDSGNWQGDTLTEDLDLSYRAQLRGWKFKYLEEVEAPAERPITLAAAKSQQFRWNKGAAENFQKNYGKLLRDKSVSAKTKFHAFFHLLNSSMFLVVLLLAVLSVPVLYVKANNPGVGWYFYVLAFFGTATLVFFACYWFAFKKIHGGRIGSFLGFIGQFILFFSVAMGFSVHNSLAVLEGHFGKKSGFVRTPKFGFEIPNPPNPESTNPESRIPNPELTNPEPRINQSQINQLTLLFEISLVFYFAFGIYSAFSLNDFGLVVFHLMLGVGFGVVVWKGFKNPFGQKAVC
jgi:cellulose synthase/poly-beta-1,6-N-acetylglucosamine synthase-like glycosyltransferase